MSEGGPMPEEMTVEQLASWLATPGEDRAAIVCPSRAFGRDIVRRVQREEPLRLMGGWWHAAGGRSLWCGSLEDDPLTFELTLRTSGLSRVWAVYDRSTFVGEAGAGGTCRGCPVLVETVTDPAAARAEVRRLVAENMARIRAWAFGAAA